MAWRMGIWRAAAILISIIAQGTMGIRITGVKVPKYLEVGSGANLDCFWEEESDKMYSVKWYQAAKEFYRYTPKALDPIQIFDPPTLDVERQKSWGGSVRIDNVTLKASGPFHCEVSADSPTFHTASRQDVIHVIDPPDGGPMIQGLRTQYLVGDWVDITCVSRRAKPAPYLSFTVNQQPAVPGWVEPQVNQEVPQGLITSYLRMRFSLTSKLLLEGYARVRCKAYIPGVYEDVVENILNTTPPYQASVLDGVAAAGDRPKICSTRMAILGTLLVTSLYRQLL